MKNLLECLLKTTDCRGSRIERSGVADVVVGFLMVSCVVDRRILVLGTRQHMMHGGDPRTVHRFGRRRRRWRLDLAGDSLVRLPWLQTEQNGKGTSITKNNTKITKQGRAREIFVFDTLGDNGI